MKKTQSILLVLATFLIVNCSPQLTEGSVAATATSQPAVTMTPDIKPSETATYTPSPIPFHLILPALTLSPQEAEESLLKLLRTNGDCTGKCVAGIWPDEMTVQEAVDVMAQWGMVRLGENQGGESYVTLIQNSLNGDIFVYLSARASGNNSGAIKGVSIRIEKSLDRYINGDFWLKNQEQWKSFSLYGLLKAYGIPSYVGYFFQTTVSPGTSLEGRTINYIVDLHFEHIDLVIEIISLANYDGENLIICPSKDPHYLKMEINPERPLIE